jgi:hypothetical protein
MTEHDSNKHDDKPGKPAKADAEFDRRVRTGIASLPLAGRQEWAEQMRYADGRPLSADEGRVARGRFRRLLRAFSPGRLPVA